MADSRALVDVSLELAHVYPSEIKRGAGGWRDGEREAAKRAIEALVVREAPWARLLRDALLEAGRSVHVSVMVDDYSAAVDASCVVDIARFVTRTLETVGVPVEHVALESECVHGAERMLRQVLPTPPGGIHIGTGNTPLGTPAGLPGPWLTNEDHGPSTPRLPAAAIDADPFADPDEASEMADEYKTDEDTGAAECDPSPGGHSINLDVELWSGTAVARRWSCPTLAACWQIGRLGALRDSDNRPIRFGVPANALDQLLADEGRDLPMPAARTTVTILDPRMQKVEHAVRSVLSRVVIPPEWCSHLRSPQDHLERIGYIFPPMGALSLR